MTSKDIFAYSANLTKTAKDMLEHPCYSHTRLSRWTDCGDNSIWVYFRCSDSPSGVLMAGSFKLTPETEALLRGKNIRANLGPSRGDIAAANPPGTVSFGTSVLTGKTVALYDPKGLLA